MKRFRIASIALVSVLTASAQSPEQPQAQWVSEVSAIAPGQPFSVALTLPHPEGWHSYYHNSSGVELPPQLEWSVPEGFTAGPIQWPVPDVVPGDSGNSLAYEHGPTLLIDLTPPAGLEAGSSATLGLKVEWQYCSIGRCINADDQLELTLPVAVSATPDPDQAGFFSEARAKLPREAAGWSFTASREGKHMTFRFEPPNPLPADTKAHFIPNERFVEPGMAEAVEATDGLYALPLTQALEDFTDDEFIPIGDSVSGMLVVGHDAYVVPETAFTSAPAVPLSLARLLPVLGGMLLGGLILNLMPCVFPVIGLKIMGFVQQAGEDRKKIVLHGLTFTAGVLVSFWILSGILFALRSAASPGQEVGWGYQLQNPWTILVLMLLMFVLGLSMYGVFELGTSATGVGGKLQAKQGLAGSFFSGILATVVATPCSAPFLGAAIGIAVGLPLAQYFLAFTFMALGLSLPYLVLSLFPALVERLPRPGPWMESFKQAMSFLLFATAGFLLWVYVGQIELDHMLDVVIGLSLIAIAAWIFGRWATPVRSPRVRWIARGLTLLFAVVGFLATRPPTGEHIEWEPWSEEKVEALLDEGTPVYVDFTAQWCATCQANKRRAYPEDVVKLMKERGIVALRADKTKPNPAIEAKLEELQRSAIPVNVLYVPGEEPIITPEVLSADYLRELFESKVPPPGAE